MDIDLNYTKNEYFSKKLKVYIDVLFESNKKIKGILLFGSLAREEAEHTDKKMSDIDLMIIFKDKELPDDHSTRSELQLELMNSAPSSFDSIWMTETEFKNSVKIKYDILLSALHEGKILFDPDGLIKEQKQQLFDELERKGVKKRKNYWIWPLKRLGEEINW